MSDRKVKLSVRIFTIVIFFLLFWCMTFTAENFYMSIMEQIKAGKFDPSFRAANNSHTGQWVMAAMLILITPWFFKGVNALSKKHVLFGNLFVIFGASAIICSTFELLVGLILNVWLKLNVWHYEYLIFNVPNPFLGQIDVVHTFIWGFASVLAFILFRGLYFADSEFAEVTLKGFKDLFFATFTKAGNIKKINPYFFDIEADYMNKEKTSVQ